MWLEHRVDEIKQVQEVLQRNDCHVNGAKNRQVSTYDPAME